MDGRVEGAGQVDESLRSTRQRKPPAETTVRAGSVVAVTVPGRPAWLRAGGGAPAGSAAEASDESHVARAEELVDPEVDVGVGADEDPALVAGNAAEDDRRGLLGGGACGPLEAGGDVAVGAGQRGVQAAVARRCWS